MRPSPSSTLFTLATPHISVRGPALSVVACLAVAVASLLWQATPGFDPWMWAQWGRDLAGGQLDTTMVVAWKPLPVLTTAPLSLLGLPAAEAWLVVARAGGLLAVVAAYRLATRVAGRGAGGVAAAALLLSPAVDGRFLRLVLQGSVEPLVAALCLVAVECHLDRRDRAAVLLLAAAALARPEVWGLLVLYAAWQWRRAPSLRPWLLATVVGLPVVWLGGDWIGSGDPLTGATRAQVLDTRSEQIRQAVFATSRTVAIPVWVAAAVGAATALRRRDPTLVVLTVAALGWIVVIGAMALVFGYAAIGRFLLPAAAGLCVVAGVGTVRLVDLGGHRRRSRLVVSIVLAAVTVPFAVPVARMALGDEGVALTTRRAALAEDLDQLLARAGGRDAVLACGAVGVGTGPHFGVLWPAVAYKLDVPLREVERPLASPRGVALLLSEQRAARRLAQPGSGAVVLARTAHWTAFAVGCPDATSDARAPNGAG